MSGNQPEKAPAPLFKGKILDPPATPEVTGVAPRFCMFCGSETHISANHPKVPGPPAPPKWCESCHGHYMKDFLIHEKDCTKAAPAPQPLPRSKWIPCHICGSDYDGVFCNSCRNEPVLAEEQPMSAEAWLKEHRREFITIRRHYMLGEGEDWDEEMLNEQELLEAYATHQHAALIAERDRLRETVRDLVEIAGEDRNKREAAERERDKLFFANEDLQLRVDAWKLSVERLKEEISAAKTYMQEAGDEHREWKETDSLATWVHNFGKDIEAELRRLQGGEPAWRCFYCDFTTSDRAEAAAHFGDRDDADEFKPICKWWQLMEADERIGTLQELAQQLNAEHTQSDALHTAICQAVALMNQGDNAKADAILRAALDSAAPTAEPKYPCPMCGAEGIEVCSGCGAKTSERDCGCPCGTHYICSRNCGAEPAKEGK